MRKTAECFGLLTGRGQCFGLLIDSKRMEVVLVILVDVGRRLMMQEVVLSDVLVRRGSRRAVVQRTVEVINVESASQECRAREERIWP